METSDLYFGAVLHLLLLRDGVGDHHGFKAGVIDTRDGRAREDAMCKNGVNLCGTSGNQSEKNRETKTTIC